MAFLVTGAIVAGAIGVAGGAAKLGVSLAGRRGRINEQKAAKAEFDSMKKEYKNLDTSNLAAGFKNPYANMENTMEDLTVNTQQAQFEAQQNQQNQANIMQGMQGAAGGSGIASLAQAMANQGQMAARQASASIGQQESRNQQMKVAGAQDVQRRRELERQGEATAEGLRLGGATDARGLEYQKQEGLMGLAAGELSATNEAVAAAKAQKAGGISQIIGGVASGVGSLAAGGAFDRVGKTGISDFMNKYAK